MDRRIDGTYVYRGLNINLFVKQQRPKIYTTGVAADLNAGLPKNGGDLVLWSEHTAASAVDRDLAGIWTGTQFKRLDTSSPTTAAAPPRGGGAEALGGKTRSGFVSSLSLLLLALPTGHDRVNSGGKGLHLIGAGGAEWSAR